MNLTARRGGYQRFRDTYSCIDINTSQHIIMSAAVDDKRNLISGRPRVSWGASHVRDWREDAYGSTQCGADWGSGAGALVARAGPDRRGRPVVGRGGRR